MGAAASRQGEERRTLANERRTLTNDDPLARLTPYGSPEQTTLDVREAEREDDLESVASSGDATDENQPLARQNQEERDEENDAPEADDQGATTAQQNQQSRGGARRTRALLRLLNVSDPAMLFYLALVANVPQMAAVAVVFPLYWHADDGLCDAALRRYWRVWGGVHALRLGATTVVAGLRWRFHRDEGDDQRGGDDSARRRAAALVANARNSLDAIALIWFVFGNMWLLGGSDSACGGGSSSSGEGDGDSSSRRHHRDDPTQSPVYVVDVVMLAIQYAQICLPCVFAIAMVPVFCFCLPCVIRLLAALHEPPPSRGASRRAINDLPITTYTDTMDLGDDPSCPVCLTPFENGDRLRLLPCKHAFHQPCVDEWLNRNASCPVCRRTIFASASEEEPSSAEAASNRGRQSSRRPGGSIEMEAQLAAVV